MRILVMHSDGLFIDVVEKTIDRFLRSNTAIVDDIHFRLCTNTRAAHRIFNEVQPDIVILNHRWSSNPQAEETGLAFVLDLLRGLHRPVQFVIVSADGSIKDQCQMRGIEYLEADFENLVASIKYHLESTRPTS